MIVTRSASPPIAARHDAIGDVDFSSPEIARRFNEDTLSAYDAITVCSEEDGAVMARPNVACVPNGSSIELGGYRPSQSSQLLFMGPFRYGPNLDGARATAQRTIRDGNRASDVIKRLRALFAHNAHSLEPGNPTITYHLIVALNASAKRSDALNLLKPLLSSGAQFADRQEALKLYSGWRR